MPTRRDTIELPDGYSLERCDKHNAWTIKVGGTRVLLEIRAAEGFESSVNIDSAVSIFARSMWAKSDRRW